MLLDQPLDWQVKGAPVLPAGTTIADFVRDRPNVFDAGFLPPLMVLRDSALRSNLATMAEFCRSTGTVLAPHGKTHMAPALAKRQLDAGAWGITVATPSQARVYRAAGFTRILLANELVDPAAIAWIAGEVDAGLKFTCYVDSLDGVALLAAALPAGSRPLDVLVEVGPEGARTGVRTVEQAVAVARAAAEVSRLRVVGISAYEGGFGNSPGAPDEQTQQEVREFLRLLRTAGEAISATVPADADFIASAGGSVYFDLVAEELTRDWKLERPVTVVLRSGCYLTHDNGSYLRKTPFGRTLSGQLTPAIEVWASVLSRPEPGLALVGMGRRDVAFDIDLPVAESIRHADGSQTTAAGITVTALNDQHGYLHLDADSPLRVGDLVRFGISHPCTALDKWRFIPVVDDDYRVIDYVRTFF
ncbi:MAG TPA: alanine racemase [Mycobacteriales bacterium]|jgi:D-serine deaminase-like pyridoxal phosphate-dependent protein|nr:alanine racemase [Mycobacteriales bacterium]